MVFVLISSFVGILVTALLALFATKYFKPNIFLVCGFLLLAIFRLLSLLCFFI